MAGDGRPRHCGRRADEAWPHGLYVYLPRGGICDDGEPGSRRPVAAGSPPGHPAHRAAGQWRSRSGAASPPGPVPARGGAGQTAVRRHCRSRGPGLRGGPGPRGKRPLPGKRRTCRLCYTPPASAVMARGDVAAGRRGRIADMTTHAAGLAAVSSLPLAGQRAAPACRLCVAGRWRVRRSRAARNSRFWCQSFAGLLLPRSHRLRCSGRLADSCPRQEETLSLAVSCSWRPSQRGGSRAPVSEPARPGEPGPAVAGLRGSQTARTVPARPARQASPLGWWSRSRYRPVATVASPCHPRPRA